MTTFSMPAAIADRDIMPSYNDDGKRPETLFYFDLAVALPFGYKAVRETLDRVGDIAKRDPYEVTELYMALNHLLWRIADEGADREGKIYRAIEDMHNAIDELAPTWDEESRRHFYEITD